MYPSRQTMNGRVRPRNGNSYTKYVVIILTLVLIYFIYSWSYNSNSLSEDDKYVFENNKKVKKILFWNKFWGSPLYGFGLGTEPFKKHNCSFQDCMLVYDGWKTSVEDYDAVIFHGPEYYPFFERDYPANRLPSQRFIYFSMESPLINQASTRVDNFFNWTMTYRLDSDILVIYFLFYDIKTKDVVSHRTDAKWREKTVIEDSLQKREAIFKTKSKPVAWFVSNCRSKNQREERAHELQKYIDVDIYGKCGPLQCHRDVSDMCTDMLKKDYYFYLSFENSNCLDYITEKQSTAYLHDAIPIYYGGANLTKFLPPHSYIDAGSMSAQELADRMKYLMDNPKEYLEYFWWKDFYGIDTRHEGRYQPFCKLCEMLHDTNLPVKTYKEFYKWWNSHNEDNVCQTF